MLVELKNGETLNGHLANCDNWMNLILREVVQTSPEGDRFFKLPEVYIRGNNVRFFLPPRSVLLCWALHPGVFANTCVQCIDQVLTNPRGNHRNRQGAAGCAGVESWKGWWVWISG